MYWEKDYKDQTKSTSTDAAPPGEEASRGLIGGGAMPQGESTSRGFRRSEKVPLNSEDDGRREIAPHRREATAPEARGERMRKTTGDCGETCRRDGDLELPMAVSMHGAGPKAVLDRVGPEAASQASAGRLTPPNEKPHPSPQAAGEERRTARRGKSISEEGGPDDAVVSAGEIFGPPERKAAPE